jgi:uncharacterized protein
MRRAVTDPQAKLRAMDSFIHRFYPGRTAVLPPPNEQKIKAVNILEMEIEDAAAKIRSTGAADEEADYDLPVWCAVLPLRTVLGEPEECPRQLPAITRVTGGAGDYVAGRRFDEVMLTSHRKAYAAPITSATAVR